MNMFSEQAAAKKKKMEALKAEATAGKGVSAEAKPNKASATKASKSKGERKGNRRRDLSDIVAEQESASGRAGAKRKRVAKGAEEPSKPQKEKIARRTSFSFTNGEYERLSRFAHEHYTTMKGAIFLMMDFMEAAEAELEEN